MLRCSWWVGSPLSHPWLQVREVRANCFRKRWGPSLFDTPISVLTWSYNNVYVAILREDRGTDATDEWRNAKYSKFSKSEAKLEVVKLLSNEISTALYHHWGPHPGRYALNAIEQGSHQARNHGGAGGEAPVEKFLPNLEKCVGHSSKNLGPSRKTLRPSWCSKLVAGLALTLKLIRGPNEDLWSNPSGRIVTTWRPHYDAVATMAVSEPD